MCYFNRVKQLSIHALVCLSTFLASALGQEPSTRASSQPAGSLGTIDVYLIGGQSNATGQGYLANLPVGFTIDERVSLFHSGRPHLDSGAKALSWMALRQASESPDRFGPELGFGNRLQEQFRHRKIALIKHAHSGTNLYLQWNPGADAADAAHFGPQFKIFVDTVDAGMMGLRNLGYEPMIRGMIWQQGENDADARATAAGADIAYGKNLAHFIARVREQLGAPEMVFVYGYVMPPPNVGEGRDRVRLGEKNVDQDSGSPLAVRGAFVVPTDDLSQRADDPNTRYPKDHLHFGTAGILELGKRMADVMKAYVQIILATFPSSLKDVNDPVPTFDDPS
ncbi:MAG: sialate O-acetylesterase [Planctomycetota bacterium]|nr:sialate O-acetylesterase [Planctomycetota bacterium]